MSSCQKSYFYNCADHVETVSGKLVDFRKTRSYDSARQSEAGSTNEKNGGLTGGTMCRDFDLIQLSYFNDKPTIEIMISCY